MVLLHADCPKGKGDSSTHLPPRQSLVYTFLPLMSIVVLQCYQVQSELVPGWGLGDGVWHMVNPSQVRLSGEELEKNQRRHKF